MVSFQQERKTEELHSKFPQCFHHSQQLFAGGTIVSLSFRMLLTEVSYHPLLATLLLGEYSPEAKSDQFTSRINQPSIGSMRSGAVTRPHAGPRMLPDRLPFR